MAITTLDGEVLSIGVDDRSRGVFHRECGCGAAFVVAHVRRGEGHRHRACVAAIVAQGWDCGAHAPRDVTAAVVRRFSAAVVGQPEGQGLVVAEVSSALDGHVLGCSVNAWRDFVVDRDDLFCFNRVVAVVSHCPSANQQVVVLASEVHGGFFVVHIQVLVHEVRVGGVEEHHVLSACHRVVFRNEVKHWSVVVDQVDDDFSRRRVAAQVGDRQHTQVRGRLTVVHGVWLVGTST